MSLKGLRTTSTYWKTDSITENFYILSQPSDLNGCSVSENPPVVQVPRHHPLVSEEEHLETSYWGAIYYARNQSQYAGKPKPSMSEWISVKVKPELAVWCNWMAGDCRRLRDRSCPATLAAAFTTYPFLDGDSNALVGSSNRQTTIHIASCTLYFAKLRKGGEIVQTTLKCISLTALSSRLPRGRLPN